MLKEKREIISFPNKSISFLMFLLGEVGFSLGPLPLSTNPSPKKVSMEEKQNEKSERIKNDKALYLQEQELLNADTSLKYHYCDAERPDCCGICIGFHDECLCMWNKDTN